ncbi:glycosyltransferase [Serratia rubidaea]|uniref:glycosyltransferase n=1 Tax=Serratia rubidaea TaxID=61652 RepID=UPI001BB091C6|nr:glycosyltransferase [Serratia rubidaea]MBS0972407.1 glycosyltransferase family 2 protein [Serratia rubidaea]MDC6111580.1 glycosyltransferase [Serratia rubidaea]UJD82604.1 glycosyltransferase family 2 protein [Serratia rubidaea]UJD87164.1 glycosyltransferase family 2 protein [Serratia rubidaea]WBF47762.1 glycosyltransferase family 2 protein [Serratia rubidaea]
MRYIIAVPTYNGGAVWRESAKNIIAFGAESQFVYVIDSGSKDDTLNVAKSHGFKTLSIESKDFNHGGTRNLAVENNIDNADVIIFLTQDAIPQPGFLEKIMAAFDDPAVACAYGRQLPHVDANPLARHARTFNYGATGYVSDMGSKDTMGIKTVFTSNSFSAYRVSTFKEIGGFPSSTILAEDMYFAAKAVMAGYKVAYCADAVARHSHNYSPAEEFKRYFDIGVFHQDEAWIRQAFGGAGGEGKKFILSELSYLLKNAPLWIPTACINNFSKIVGYKLGQNYKKLSPAWRKKLSMHKRYWDSVSN